MKVYIDTEFNGFGGDLISMALVSEYGDEWYEVLECENPVPWVAEHVMPILEKKPLPKEVVQNRLEKFLNQWSHVRVIADWPEDIAHFCRFLITGPGMKMRTPFLSFEIQNIISGSKVPHNALHDARGIKQALALEEGRGGGQ